MLKKVKSEMKGGKSGRWTECFKKKLKERVNTSGIKGAEGKGKRKKYRKNRMNGMRLRKG